MTAKQAAGGEETSGNRQNRRDRNVIHGRPGHVAEIGRAKTRHYAVRPWYLQRRQLDLLQLFAIFPASGNLP
jgi:hypothetical protein